MATFGQRGGLTRHLSGSGIEVGPGHHPLVESNDWLAVRYVDRWEPQRNAELFPDLAGAAFVEPDVLVDLNRDALEALASVSEDFVVCSHVLEHLANPLRAINDFHRVLRPGGTLLILLPDRRRTFDRTRQPTSLEHIVAEFDAGVVEVDDEHIVDFLTNTGVDPDTLRAIATDSEERAGILEFHRCRSIHVHCWTLDEFLPVLQYSIERLGNQWEFVDGVTSEELGPEAIEFGVVLRRGLTDLPPAARAKLFSESIQQWLATSRATLQHREAAEEHIARLESELEHSRTRLALTEAPAAELESAQRSLSAVEAEMQRLLATRTFRYTARIRKLYCKARRMLSKPGRLNP